MATNEQIESLLERLKKAPPSECFANFDMNTVGIRAILRLLNETDERVTAGRISECMKVSTARVAVLLKKMTVKGLIEKGSDSADGRVVVVRLTDHGKRTADIFRESLYGRIGEMIDRVGMEKMLEFAAISSEIQAVMKETHGKLDI